MTISSTTNRVSFAGNGSTTAFSFPHPFHAQGDLVVILRVNSTGVETTKTITTHYTISGTTTNNIYADGGTVTMVTAPATGETLIIYRDPALTQGLDLVENDSLPAESTEQALDRNMMVSQRLKDRVDRTVRLSDGFSPTFDLTLPVDLDDAGDKVPLINSAGTGWAAVADWPTADEIDDAAASATAAAASASAAATSASAASTSESNAATSATAAAASATAAATSAASMMWNDVQFLTSADSPFTVPTSASGRMYAVDCTGGAVTINLPSIAALDLTLPWVVGIKKTDGSGNAITVARNGTDTIDGGTSKSIGSSDSGAAFIPDTDTAPDEWTTADFGAGAGNLTVQNFSGDGATTGFTLSVDPGTENATWVFISGVYQQKNTYSLSGTTLTFGAAPASGTDNIEVMIGSSLPIGTPSDGTVTRAKMATGGIAKDVVAAKTAAYTATSSDDVILADASSGAFTVTLPTAVGNGGRKYTVKKTDTSANAVTVDGDGTETIDGATTHALLHQYASVTVISDNANWIVLSPLSTLVPYVLGFSEVVGSTAADGQIPADNTIPQVTEGTQILTVTVTPRRIGAKLHVSVNVKATEETNTGAAIAIALFKDGAANAVAVDAQGLSDATTNLVESRFVIEYVETVASLTAITFTVRIGGSAAATDIVLNESVVHNVPADFDLGGKISSWIKVTEEPY